MTLPTPEHNGVSPVKKIKAQFPAQLSEVSGARQILREFLEAHQCSGQEIFACELALAEACNNSVEHAQAEAKIFEVEICCSDKQIEVEVIDFNEPFVVPGKVELPGNDSESGRGLFLMKELMDQVQFSREEGSNVCRMCRQRSDSSS
jgi:serine/threonine-protein kinase RsbW